MKNKTIENQDVLAAFNLLNETMSEEKTRIFKKGAEAMQNEDEKTSQSVLDFAKKIGELQKDVALLVEKWEDLMKLRDSLTPQMQKIVTGEGRLFPPRKTGYKRNVTHPLQPKTGLVVTFPDGTEIAAKKAKDVFAKTIERIGAERVAELGIMCGGEKLVSKSPSGKQARQSHEIANGFYVKTHSSTADKKKQLVKISDKLNLGLAIEIVKSNRRFDSGVAQW